MRVLLLTLWKPSMGGVVTHVENLMRHSRNEFRIISYPPVRIPLLRAAGFTVAGLIKGLGMSFDVIHAHYAVPQGFLGLILKALKRRPLVVTLHGSDVTVLGRNPLTRPLVGLVLRGADRVIAVSEFLRREAHALGADPGKTRVIYGGGPGPTRPTPRKGRGRRRRVLYVGALVRQKGVDVLVKAFSLLREQDAELVIVGDGVERGRLERMCRELGVKADFRGYLVDIGAALRDSDVLVLPSREEGLGLVLLEAMARGVPVVATRAGGIPELVVDGENGLLVEREDPEGLAEALERLLRDQALARRLVEGGLETAGSFTWEKMAGEVDEVYAELEG
jgi:glycosyltransferase involved in cell wall biosynthesis